MPPSVAPPSIAENWSSMPNSCAVSCHATLVNSFDLGLDPDIGKWNEQFDVDLATVLMEYYGPEGEWWETEGAESLESSISLSPRDLSPRKAEPEANLRPGQMGRRQWP